MNPPKPSRTLDPEWAVIGALSALAAVLRLARFGRLGIDHFDEGIYASVGSWSIVPGGLAAIDPGVIPYAPPGYPFLVGLSYFATSAPSDRGAILVSILVGIAAVPVAGWLARRTFGPGAGLAASAMAALSGPHITFSRMALTDATFLLAWLAAMIAGGRFVERPGPARAIVLGLSVGLAQLVKYNGWLAGAVVAATALLGPLVAIGERTRHRLVRTFGWGMLAAGVASLVYLPCFLFVEAHGGYAGLIRHQRGYLDGPSHWAANWLQQLRQLDALNNHASAGPIAALLGLAALTAMERRGQLRRVGGAVGLLILATIVYRASMTWWIGLAVVAYLVREGRPAARLVGVWWLALSILTPLYHPYARLWLPLEASGWLLVAMAVSAAVRWSETRDAAGFRPARVRAFAVLIALVAGWVVPGMIRPIPVPLPDGPLAPRDSLRMATYRIVKAIPAEAQSILMLGRPAIFFYASPYLGWRRIASGRAADVEALLAPDVPGWALVDGALLRQEGEPTAMLDRLRARWVIVAEEPTTLSSATLLDVDPRAATGDLSARSEPLLLLRARP